MHKQPKTVAELRAAILEGMKEAAAVWNANRDLTGAARIADALDRRVAELEDAQ